MSTLLAILLASTAYFALKSWRLDREPIIQALDAQDVIEAEEQP